MIMKKLNTFLSLLFVASVTTSFGQVLQDWPCGGLLATSQVTINAPCANITTAGATPGFDPGSCGSANVDEAWAWFIGDGSNLAVQLTGLSNDALIHIIEVSAPPCGGITDILCNNNDGANNETIIFDSNVGSTYLIRVQEDAGVNITGCLSVTTPVPGCTDPLSTSYNPAATVEDGSCSYAGVDYVHPLVGGGGEFVGACLVNDCGPFTYTDDGGSGGNYALDIGAAGPPHFGGIYRVFCPDMAGNCMQVTFNSFNTEAGWDYLQVKNGPTQNSPEFAALHAATPYGVNGMSGNLAGSMPATFTSTDASGCLTFRFFSDFTITGPGWNATMQCVPCAGGPSGTDNNDCMVMTPLCNVYSQGSDATGPGLTSDGCNFGSCPAGGENHTNWFTVTADNAGTLDITIVPDDPADDYDFTVYGPNVTCAALGDPLRCSDAAAVGTTGTGGDTDTWEPASGNGQVATINAGANDSYIIVVDEWSPNPSSSGYTMNFGGTATLDCSILPVELAKFDVEYYSDEHTAYLTWKTMSELNNDRFEVQRSKDGEHFETIQVVKGAGTTSMETSYISADTEPTIGVNYYRLKQVDFNGATRMSEIRSINILDDFYDILAFTPNPTTGETEVIFNSYRKENVVLQVISVEGKEVVNMELPAAPGGNRFDLDLTDIEGNIFFVTITTSNKTYSGKVVKR
ncbi:MAG: hypothetical protein Crog4KO_05300 [Crocinitomicaceae bacterium]